MHMVLLKSGGYKARIMGGTIIVMMPSYVPHPRRAQREGGYDSK
jgi:hypothetical protein